MKGMAESVRFDASAVLKLIFRVGLLEGTRPGKR